MNEFFKEHEDDSENEYDERNINVEGEPLLNIKRCEEKATSKKLKGKIKRDIYPELNAIESSNSKITNELDEIINCILNNDPRYANATEETLETLAELLIYHSVIEENVDNIKLKTTKL